MSFGAGAGRGKGEQGKPLFVKKGTIMVIYSKKEIKKDSVGNHVADVILLWDLCR